MRKKFFCAQNKDCDEMYRAALVGAGYLETGMVTEADFIVHDAVHPNLGHALMNKTNFITPHVPQGAFLWDGLLETRIPTACNFVTGPGSKEVLESYGYPYRVEVTGFNRCQVRPFKPTEGNDLLIIPSHPLQHGEYTYPRYIDWAVNILRFVLKNRSRFGKITLCWSETHLDPALKEEMFLAEFDAISTDPYKDTEPLKTMMRRIERADLVLGCGTAGCVAVAMGKPTVFITELGQPRTNPKDALRPDLYHHILRFPLHAEDMSINEIMAVRIVQNPKVEYWKQRIIGGNFDSQKFLGVVGEYVKL